MAMAEPISDTAKSGQAPIPNTSTERAQDATTNTTPRDTKPSLSDAQEIPPTTAVSALTSKQKTTPFESPQAISLRRRIIISFWLLILLLGLPLWISTQRVIRSPLPEADINAWSSGQACRPVFPLRIEIEAPGLKDEDAQGLVKATQLALDDLNDFSAHHLRLRLSDGTMTAGKMEGEYSVERREEALEGNEETALTVRLIPGNVQSAALQPYDTIMDVYYLPGQLAASAGTSSATGSLPSYIASHLRDVFQEERNMIRHLLASSPFQSTENRTTPLDPAVEERLRKRDVRAVKYARTYHLTFSLFTPTAEPSEWPIEQVLQNDMAPLLDALSPLSNFTVDSQIQLFASAGVQPVSVITQVDGIEKEVKKVWRREDLPSFVNHAEWPLTPSIGEAPTLHFLIYISPYPIAGTHGASSFLIPQMGGVVILPSASEEELKEAMRIFSTQLLDLLGAPSSSITPAPVTGEEGNSIHLSLPLRLGALIRHRTLSLLLSTSSILASLLHLTTQLSSIPIPSSVASLATSSIANLGIACSNLGSLKGLEAARSASEMAEKAFFDKRMVGQVYFPDEHRVAVLLPLLGPVGVPLVMAAAKEVKGWIARRKFRKI